MCIFIRVSTFLLKLVTPFTVILHCPQLLAGLIFNDQICKAAKLYENWSRGFYLCVWFFLCFYLLEIIKHFD